MKKLSTVNLSLHARQKQLCRTLSLQILPGDIVGILGANGCGKTTLLHTLAGLHTPQSGSVLLDDQPLQHYTAKTLARIRGILFQDTHHGLPISVNDYCLASRYPHQPFFQRRHADDVLLIADVLQKMELTHLKQTAVTQLSGGEKRRLAIAALLIQAPFIYLLDEPTNHLDIRHQLSVMQHLASLAASKQASIVMTLHNIRLAQTYCSRIVLIFPNGETRQGTPDTMLTRANLSELYGCDVNAILY